MLPEEWKHCRIVMLYGTAFAQGHFFDSLHILSMHDNFCPSLSSIFPEVLKRIGYVTIAW